MKKVSIIGVLILICIIYNITGALKGYKKEIKEVSEVAARKGFNTNYCILIDFSRHSGERRMHLVDLNTTKVVKSFAVAQGRGDAGFSNVPGSNCSSLGMAVTRERGGSMYGIGVKYVLEGLDTTNSSIRRRNVVLHSWGGIPPFGIFPLPLYQSKGCPTVANKTLTAIDKLIKGQRNKQLIVYTFK